MTDIDEFRGYLRIDKNSLDDELQQQSTLFFEVSESLTEAMAERDFLKERLATTDAELFAGIRARSANDGEKYTESMIKAKVQTATRHKEAMAKFLEAKKQTDLLFGLKEAFSDRREMLGKLCTLYTSNYFEVDAVKMSSGSDRAAYVQRRQKMAEGRKRRE